MIITGADISSYGHFKDRSIDFGTDRIVTVYGPNEAGKTTFASFLVNMFFGFSPASEASHPYRSSDGSGIGGTLNFISDDRRRCSIDRELRTTPRSLFVSGEGLFGDEIDLRNRSIPHVDHLSRRVFEAVYALSLADMEHVEAKTWDVIQDRLLGGLNMEFLRPARVVVETLEQDGKSFWRPDRRGKPLAGELEDRLRKLQKELRDARQNDARLRELADSIESLASRQASLKKDRSELKQQHHVFARVQPVRNFVRRIDELRQKAGDPSVYIDVPENPVVHLRNVEHRKQELLGRRDQLAESLREVSEAESGYKPEHARLRSEEDEVRAWSSRVGRHEASITEIEECEKDIADELSRTRHIYSQTIRGDAVEDGLLQLASLDIAQLQTQLDVITSADRTIGGLSHREVSTGYPYQTYLWIAVSVLGVLITIGGVLVGEILASIAGILFAILGLVLRSQSTKSETTDQESTAKNQRAKALADVRSLVQPLALVESRIGEDGQGLLVDLLRLHDAGRNLQRMIDRKQKLHDTVDDDRRKLNLLTRSVGTDNHAVPTILIARMMRDLETANYRYQRSEEARHKRKPLLSERSSVQASLDRIEKEQQLVESLLGELGDGDVRAGAVALETMRKAASQAEQMTETLEKNYPEWREIMAQVVDDEPSGEALDVAIVDARLDEVESELQNISSRLATIREQAKTLSRQQSVSDVESKISSCRDELLSAKIKRDRLELAAAVLRRSETMFREEHQPDVIRKANEYLKLVTIGRYERLEVDDVTGELRLWDESAHQYISVTEPLSRGTLDQIYLALRMAIVDHLDANHERIPLFLDEVFVNWDSRRRERAYAILKKIAHDRQVFIFTCHQWMVDEVEELLGSKIVKI